MKRPSDETGNRDRTLYCLIGMAIAAAIAGDAGAQFVLRQDVAVGTGGTVRNSCFALTNTVGEAVASPATSGSLKLTSGIWGARPPVVRDSLLRDGFEDCRP